MNNNDWLNDLTDPSVYRMREILRAVVSCHPAASSFKFSDGDVSHWSIQWLHDQGYLRFGEGEDITRKYERKARVYLTAQGWHTVKQHLLDSKRVQYGEMKDFKGNPLGTEST